MRRWKTVVKRLYQPDGLLPGKMEIPGHGFEEHSLIPKDSPTVGKGGFAISQLVSSTSSVV
jgi:hypothetical protein